MNSNVTPKKHPREGDNENAAANRLRRPLHSVLQLGSEPIVILVRNEAEKFYIHEHLLTSYSEFFKTALSQKWKEGAERTVKLPKARVDAFRIFTNWLYTGRISSIGADDLIRKNGMLTGNEEWGRFFATYKLGDFLQATDFKDATIDAIVESCVELYAVPFYLVHTIYDSSLIESVHRRLCIDLFLRVESRSDWGDLRTRDYPHGFVMDALIEAGKHIGEGLELGWSKMLKSKDGCKYHDHVRLNKPCYKTKFGY